MAEDKPAQRDDLACPSHKRKRWGINKSLLDWHRWLSLHDRPNLRWAIAILLALVVIAVMIVGIVFTAEYYAAYYASGVFLLGKERTDTAGRCQQLGQVASAAMVLGTSQDAVANVKVTMDGDLACSSPSSEAPPWEEKDGRRPISSTDLSNCAAIRSDESAFRRGDASLTRDYNSRRGEPVACARHTRRLDQTEGGGEDGRPLKSSCSLDRWPLKENTPCSNLRDDGLTNMSIAPPASNGAARAEETLQSNSAWRRTSALGYYGEPCTAGPVLRIAPILIPLAIVLWG